MITLMAGSGQHGAWQQVVNGYHAHPRLMYIGILISIVLFDRIVVWIQSGEPNFYDVD
jgi:hypothetical protein